jgi:sirohydrochlorin cobaltochelatase
MNLADTLSDLLTRESRILFGELVLTREPDGRFTACHLDDEGSGAGLEPLDSVRALHERAKFDAAGDFRPLKTAPGLRSGWITTTGCPREFLQRLDAIYPGLFATWVAYERGSLSPVTLRDTLGRQTGMYRFAGSITDGMARRITEEFCAPGCLRRITWSFEAETATDRIERSAGTVPLPCTEACTFAVSRARELAKEAYDQANPPAAPRA